jgi:hypothetical protein
MKNISATVLLIFLSLMSCTKDNIITLSDTDSLIFGRFYGECIGTDCVEYFKLTKDSLYKFQDNTYPTPDKTFDDNFIALDNSKYELVKNLLTKIPKQLIKLESSTIGCPDCADQGGIYIAYKKEGITKEWLIDQSKSAVPSYLYDFIDDVNNSIALLNN